MTSDLPTAVGSLHATRMGLTAAGPSFPYRSNGLHNSMMDFHLPHRSLDRLPDTYDFQNLDRT